MERSVFTVLSVIHTFTGTLAFVHAHAHTHTHTHAHTVRLDKEHDRHYINQWIRPHFWFVVYSDQHTCEPHPPNIDETIEYEMEFLNPDSSGNATDHFGDNLRGI